MFTKSSFSATIRVCTIVAVAASIVACDRSLVAPETRRAAAKTGLNRDEIQGDTTRCLTGFVVIDGFYVCN